MEVFQKCLRAADRLSGGLCDNLLGSSGLVIDPVLGVNSLAFLPPCRVGAHDQPPTPATDSERSAGIPRLAIRGDPAKERVIFEGAYPSTTEVAGKAGGLLHGSVGWESAERDLARNGIRRESDAGQPASRKPGEAAFGRMG